MNTNNNYLGYLDKIRINNGTNALINYFGNLLNLNYNEALQLINDSNLSFCSLYVLHRHLNNKGLVSRSLSPKVQQALSLTDTILTKDTSAFKDFENSNSQTTYQSLKWILESGYLDDGLDNDYDQILETCAVLLVKKYNDKSDLDIITTMIFNRHRKKLYIYDLVWALFESRDPQALYMIANWLHSYDYTDVRLARKLLSFIPRLKTHYQIDIETEYKYYINWINDNLPFLKYTGESFQQTSKPILYIVYLEAKYLCQPIPSNTDTTLKTSNNSQKRIKEKFNKLNHKTKTLLANYSFWLYRQNVYHWTSWINSPIPKQINSAKRMGGGSI